MLNAHMYVLVVSLRMEACREQSIIRT